MFLPKFPENTTILIFIMSIEILFYKKHGHNYFFIFFLMIVSLLRTQIIFRLIILYNYFNQICVVWGIGLGRTEEGVWGVVGLGL